MMRLLLLFPLLLSSVLGFQNLRTEYLINPLGIDEPSPRFSWEGTSSERGWKQSAYEILVARSAEALANDDGDLWDSGKVDSDASNQISYAGKSLTSYVKAFWKVRVWDQNGTVSAWSEPAHFSMGLLTPEDWQGAEWIGYDHVPETINLRPELAIRETKLVINKASYGDPKDEKKRMDIKEKLQAHVDAGNYTLRMTNDLAGGDPAYETKKVAFIELTEGSGRRIKCQVKENEEIDLTIGRPLTEYLPAPYLRKSFQITAPILSAQLFTTAQGVVEMHLNGKRVGDEYYTPGWTDYKKRIYYRTYDVSDALVEGENGLGAILGDGWYRGNISCVGNNKYGRQLRLKTLLRVELTDGTVQYISSNKDWKATHGPIIESDMQAGEIYDARKELGAWTSGEYEENAWSPVVTSSPSQAVLESYPGDPIRVTDELVPQSVKEPKPGRYVFDLGQNFSGWARLKVSAEAGDKITMFFGEMLEADGTVYVDNLRTARAVDEYICKGDGEETWEPKFSFHGFRYVEVRGLKTPPTAETITGMVIHSDAPLTSSFQCSNPMLNRIHENIVWGQRSNYLEVPTDCPQRDERLGWTGDTQVFIRTGCYNQDVAGFFKKWLVDLEDSVDGRGMFGNQAPVFHGNGQAAWACAGIVCPWTYYRFYGDKRMLETHYDAMVRYQDECWKNGLAHNRGTWGDWLAPFESAPKPLICKVYHAYTNQLMVEMATALGKTEDAAKFQKRFEESRDYFQKHFVEEDGKIAGGLQTSYAMALSYNLLTPEQRKQAEGHLIERVKARDGHLSSGFLGIPIILPTLTEMGRGDLAFKMIQKETYPSWGYSIAQGATTIWERWNSYSKDKGFGDVQMNSFNHYSLGACGQWMMGTILGIDTAEPGFQQLHLEPEFGVLEWAKGHYDSIYGRISSNWKKDGDTYEWKITIPPNTSALIHLKTNGDLREAENRIEPIKTVKGKQQYELPSGTYTLRWGNASE